MSDWYADWQSPDHVALFDFRSGLSNENLRRNYEAYNDLTLLKAAIPENRELMLVELGCATGEMARYLKLVFPQVRYAGVDISEPALARARQKYPDAKFIQTQPGLPVADLLAQSDLARPELVFSKDVMHHQERPLSFLTEILQCATDTVVFRCRTRDQGATVWDPDQSCQYHYDGWMPYIIINIDELVAAIRKDAPEAEIRIIRNHSVLGGQLNRFVPKDCYLPETGTAESAVGVFLKSTRPGQVTIENRKDMNPKYTLGHLARRGFARAVRVAKGR
jgi:SAM-dependent methyltransferase